MLNISYFFNKEDLSTKGIVFTPQNVANELINIVDSKYLHAHAKVLDPAVGSGGLLIAYLDKLLESDPTIDLQKFVSNNLYGIDTVPENVLAAKCALLIFLELHGVDSADINLYEADSLMLTDSNIRKQLIGKMDLIIGNPPYVRAKKIPKIYRLQLREKWASVISGMTDLYIPFFALGNQMLKEVGQIVYITPNSYLSSVNGRKLRKYLLTNFNEINVYSSKAEQKFGKKIMTYSAITSLYKYRSKEIKLNYITSDEKNKIIINSEESPWRLLNKRDSTIIYKLENAFTNLSELNLKNGIATQRNDIYIIDSTSPINNFYIKDNSKIEKNITRPFVFPNKSTFKRLRIIFPYKWDPIAHKNVVIPEEEFKNSYPNAYRYLLSKKEELLKRASDSNTWYAYGRSQGLQNQGPRLYIPYMGYKVHTFLSLSDKELFAAGYAIFSKNIELLKLIKRIFESPIFTFYLLKVSKPYSSNYYSMSKNILKNFSVPTSFDSTLLTMSSSELVRSLYNISESDYEYIMRSIE
ncbi:hypothetical protein BJI45_00705 [Limosilactobacillus reuteri]|uniref:site-specific DNA-methyltransferase (adenine-specific) n=1 Tax=Limosilactobacillus reuteri TaxID=1598 RepID=A0AB36I6Q8_LIMRT|nr:hypothetical protein BJI45_00705 [Limosilactobacillus reuteri]